MSAAESVAGSFRDPSGFVFRRNGVFHREIAASYTPHYEHALASGLYDDLARDGLLIPHEEYDICLACSKAAYKVIRPSQLQFVSHPFEWSFSQLKDAALSTLQIQREALNRGMTLKDASAYNIQLHEARNVLIDTLSFEIYQPGRPWQAYRQFCQHFLAPLALMSLTDIRLGKLFLCHIDGVPLDLASRLLPFRTWFGLGLGLHVHAHARTQRRYADQTTASAQTSKAMTLQRMRSLVTHLEQTITGLKAPSQKTEWDDYYEANNNYAEDSLDAKARIVRNFLNDQVPKTVWDLGANDGRFSRIAKSCGAQTVVAWDIDPTCVDQNYLAAVSRRERGLFPLVVDLTNPSPAMGWANQERGSFTDRGPVDVLLALGLIHHMAISNNVPLGGIARYLGTLTNRLVVEWVPKEDSQVRKLLATRSDIFPDYEQSAFEAEFSRYFHILRKQEVGGTCRTLYLMKTVNGGSPASATSIRG